MVCRSNPRRIACVHLPFLALESVFREVSIEECQKKKRRDPQPAHERLQKTPCAVRSEVRGRKVLVSVSDATRAKRIRPGMTQTEARARHPKVVVRERDPAKELERLSVAAELLMAFGPTVELAIPTCLFVEVGRSRPALDQKLKGATDRAIAEAIIRTLAKAGHRARVVIAKDPDTGRSILEHLHRTRSDNRVDRVVIVPPGREREVLARLPIDAFLWTDERSDPKAHTRERLLEAKSSLALLGVEDVRRLQKLPAEQVGSRFGEAGALLMKRARAELNRPLEAFAPPERLVEELELDRVTDDLQPILFLLKRMFDRLEARLDARALSVTKIEMEFLVEPGLENVIDDDSHRPSSSKRKELVCIRFARATRRASTMLKIAKEKLFGALGMVQSITVRASSPEVDHGAQLDLFNNYEKRVEEVSELVGRLVAALGEEAVFSPEILDTHRPEAAWGGRLFDVDRALQTPPVSRPKKSHAEQTPDAVAVAPLRTRVLPAVNDDLSVTGEAQGSLQLGDDMVEGEPASWPKPVPRTPDDEPVPALPPRPLELFDTPEPASLAEDAQAGGERFLRWRGRRMKLTGLFSAERLECEWWTRSPIARDYVVAEVTDGRRFWLFYEPSGQLFVHGVFD